MGTADRRVPAGRDREEAPLESDPRLRSQVPNAPHVLREYSFVADGFRGGVLGPRGDLAWLCFPSWDGPAVFDALMGGSAAYDVLPVEPHVWGGYYEDGSMIWRDRWVTASGGIAECREALSLTGGEHRAVMLRQPRAVNGTVRLRAFLRASYGYGEEAFRSWRQREDGVWTARCGPLRLRWSGTLAGAATLRRRPTGLFAEVELHEGEQHDLVLELADGPLERELPDPGACWSATERGWRGTVPRCDATAAPRDARQAHAILLGLTVPGGGTVAAATTSLPERADEGRNYDYRYSWVRDQCFIGNAAAVCGEDLSLLDSSVSFVTGRLLADGPSMAPAYTATGAPVPAETELSLPGYPGGRSLAGNHAGKQFQLDAFGEALALFASAARHDRLDAQAWRAAEVAADAIAARWEQPDAGIWELEPREWTESRLLCIAGLRSLCEVAGPAGHLGRLVGRWAALADAILADTGARCVHESGRWQRAADDGRVDSALLLPPLRGALPAGDPRTVLTYRAVADTLTADGYAFRYRPDDRPLGEAEGAFQLCGFAMALAAAQQGDLVSAVRWFERGRSACGPAGLFTEEFDVAQRELRGNLPQAFVHALFLESAAVLGPLVDAGGGGRR